MWKTRKKKTSRAGNGRLRNMLAMVDGNRRKTELTHIKPDEYWWMDKQAIHRVSIWSPAFGHVRYLVETPSERQSAVDRLDRASNITRLIAKQESY